MVRSFEVRSSCVFEHAVIWQQFDQAPRFELSFVIQQVFGVWRYTRCDMFNATSTWHILDNVAHWCSFDTSNWCRWRVSDTPLPLKHILYSTPPHSYYGAFKCWRLAGFQNSHLLYGHVTRFPVTRRFPGGLVVFVPMSSSLLFNHSGLFVVVVVS